MNAKKDPGGIYVLFHGTVEELACVSSGPQRLVKDSQVPRVGAKRIKFQNGKV